MTKRIFFWLLWLGLTAYAFLLAPPDHPDTLTLIQNLSTGHWDEINPLVIALFNIMGVLPMLYACLLLIDGQGQKIRAFPFVIGSFLVGAFALLPYLALRRPNPGFKGEKTKLLQLVDSRWTGRAIALTALVLLTYGITQGDWPDFVQQWQTSRFIHVMSLDFCLLCLLIPALLGDDMERRSLKDNGLFWAIALTPLLGAVTYLSIRPNLQAVNLPEGN